MEGELKNLINLWVISILCLCYCYYIASKLPKGPFRFFSLLPVFYLFIILPLNLTTFHFGATSAFFFIWLANFKLLLFSFNQPPFSPIPASFFHFISLIFLPVKPKNNQFHNPNLILFSVKILIVAILFHLYSYKQFLHRYLILACYCLHLYLELEIILAVSAIPARAVFGFDLEPQFNEPYLATSLQDFWGRRWNLMVTGILRPTIYFPIRRFFMRFIGSTWAFIPAFIATFVVSGLMHEVIYFYITRVSPTWEVTWFFILHGICVAVEVAVKKMVSDRWRLRGSVSRALTLSFLAVTGVWLFFPQLIRNKIDDKVIGEYLFFVDLVKQTSIGYVSIFF
ncbi:probable long-chain-alcohol O-fatty-acyltransferase 5 [Mercurialis annua]|uniref:probable long-chain-alcohol O-fatty-acyltransferase 5 n=1 Tax=Mercurialis annua TaxID=3986 RepID=UPI0021604819|nr:probable long-chain-alcohol O-fatty-acyltransferase 5 [Mercurialis annua]